MEGKKLEEPKSVHFGDTASDEALIKALRTGIEIEFELYGEKKKAYWQKLGFSDRPLFRTYTRKKVREAEELGLIERKLIKKEISPSEPDQTVFTLTPQPAIDSDVKVDKDLGFVYSSDFNALVFDQPIKGSFGVEYFAFDEQDYLEIVNNAYACMLIYLSLRDPNDHKKKFFKNIQEVESLGQFEINSILEPYIKLLKVDEEELKKAPAPQFSKEGEISQKDTE